MLVSVSHLSAFLGPASAPRPLARGVGHASPQRPNDSAALAGPASAAGGPGDEARNPRDRPSGQTGLGAGPD
jgi:hypothetical protein